MRPLHYVLFSSRLKAALLQLNPELVLDIKNMRQRKMPYGCQGKVTDPSTGRIIAVLTGTSAASIGRPELNHQYNATDPAGRRYSGTWHFTTSATFAQEIVDLLASPHFEREFDIEPYPF